MKPQNSFKSDNLENIKTHIEIFNEGRIPRNLKGDEYNDLHYSICCKSTLNKFFEAFVNCDKYNGYLTIESKHFDDNVIYLITVCIDWL